MFGPDQKPFWHKDEEPVSWSPEDLAEIERRRKPRITPPDQSVSPAAVPEPLIQPPSPQDKRLVELHKEMNLLLTNIGRSFYDLTLPNRRAALKPHELQNTLFLFIQDFRLLAITYKQMGRISACAKADQLLADLSGFNLIEDGEKNAKELWERMQQVRATKN